MADAVPSNGLGLKIAVAALAVMAIGAGAFGFVQYQAATSLSAQLAAATKDAKQAHEDAKQAHDEASSLKTQLGMAQTQATNELQQLAAAQQQVSNEQQQLQSTQTQLAAESRPDLPITLTFRPALLGQGEVAVLQNTSNAPIEIYINVSSPSIGLRTRLHEVINGRGVLQIGQAQGWAFAPGQVVTIENGRYRPIVRTVS